MRRFVVAACGVGALVLAGCATEQHLSPEQWSAIQTREMDWDRDTTMHAAATVLLDEGYLFTMSDFGAGLVAGARAEPSNPPAAGNVIVWVSPLGAGRSAVRVEFLDGGVRSADAGRVSAFANEVNARALGETPAKTEVGR